MSQPQYVLKGIVHTRNENMEDFEGPLDVIFQLLSKNKIEIQDVSITAILEQYLAYLDERKRLELEIASEFISMASHLMLIKTKMLLSAAEQQEAETELDILRQSLLERRRKEALEQIRLAVVQLEARNDIGRAMFTKEPEPLRREPGYHYLHNMKDLRRALEAIFERNQKQLPAVVSLHGIVGREYYSVSRKAGEVLQKLLARGKERLQNLFRGNKTRSEIVATFLAILELCKNHSVILSGDTDGDDPEIHLTQPQKGD